MVLCNPLAEENGRRASQDQGLLASVRSILENVSAICDDDNIEQALIEDTPHTFHPWWADEKSNNQGITWHGSYCPRGKNVACMLDLAQILEPRPLPPSFSSQLNCSQSPSVRDLTGSSNLGMGNRAPASPFGANQDKKKMPLNGPLLSSLSSPSSSGLSEKCTVPARSIASEPKDFSIHSMDMKLPTSFLSGPYSFTSSRGTDVCSTKGKSNACSMHSMAMLPESFVPGPYTVVIGRGREARQAPGNHRLRSLATTYIDDYSSASSTEKSRKSQIVAAICREIRVVCPVGAFVRFGPDGRWYEVPDSVAMEKVGYTLRELVGERYRSSSKAKKAARQESFATG